MKTEKKLITIYCSSDFLGNVVKHTGTLLNCGVSSYAQYNKSPFVDFIPAGKRKALRIRKTFHPYLLVLVGNNLPAVPDAYTQGRPDDNGTTVRQSVYLSFDERYKADFDKIINPIIESNGSLVLMDYRHTMHTEKNNYEPINDKKTEATDSIR